MCDAREIALTSSTSPAFNGLDSEVTFDENTVNATPRLLDQTVSVTGVADYNGGTLVVSGLLAEDTVSIRNEGSAAGQIGFSAGTITYGGIIIGTVTGGTAGANLLVSFNANATSPAVQALIENLAYANSSDTPMASRTLTINLRDGDGDLAGHDPTYLVKSGSDNPLNGVDIGDNSAPTFGDLDHDGDLDMIAGNDAGTLAYFQNIGTVTEPVFVQQTGAASPVNGIDIGDYSRPALADIDGDGDLDLVVGEYDGTINYFKNTGTASAPVFVEKTGNANPFNGIDIPGQDRFQGESAPTFADLDNDGDLDMVVGGQPGKLLYYKNTGTATAPVYVHVAEGPDGIDVGFISKPTFGDVDGDGDLDMVVGHYGGTSQPPAIYYENIGTVSSPSFLLHTGAADPFAGIVIGVSNTPALVDIDGDGVLDIVSGRKPGDFQYLHDPSFDIVVNVTAQAESPVTTPVLTFTDLDTSVTFDENAVNAAPRIIDANVTVTDAGGNNFNGGSLVVSGLLSQDTVGIHNEGTAAGQIGFSGGTISYGGVTVGTATGGAGANLVVSLNANATAPAVEALIENLTYANSSNTPTALRDLLITLTDGSGHVAATPLLFEQRTGASDPTSGINSPDIPKPAFVDLDGDGDYDLAIGGTLGQIQYYKNVGTTAAPVFTQLTGSANPFDGFSVGYRAKPTFVDLDGDGDQDMVVGNKAGTFAYFENTGSVTDPHFVQQTGSANPLDAFDFVGSFDDYANGAPTFGDIDGDGDQDMFAGVQNGGIFFIENTGTATTPVFVQQTGTNNPMAGFNVLGAVPKLIDLDNDGDLDMVVGGGGFTHYFLNTGTSTAPAFVEQTGSANPFQATQNLGGDSNAAAFADLDGDGDADLLIGFERDFQNGNRVGQLSYFENVTFGVAVNVTAEGEAPVASPSTRSVGEDNSLSTSVPAATDADGTIAGYALNTTVGQGELKFNADGSYTFDAHGHFDGLAAGAHQAVTFTYHAIDNDGNESALETVTITVNGANDAPVLSGVKAAVTFNENTVNAGAQVIDSDVAFRDIDGNLNGGRMVVSGVLAEDTVSIANQGTGSGQIGFSGGTVTYGGVTIGAATGGHGSAFTVVFNANATSAAVDALIQNLTYANSSDTPTASRTLNIRIADGAGANAAHGDYVAQTGAANPFNGIDVGTYSSPTFGDLDGDGDLDMQVGAGDGVLHYFENTGTATSPVFVERTGSANPFVSFNVGNGNHPALVDLDGDGDLDDAVGQQDGTIKYLLNTGSSASPTFIAQTGAANPFNGIDVGTASEPTFVDLDHDGDRDLVVGGQDGTVHYFENVGSAATPIFVERTGGANPFDGIDVGSVSSPHLGDVDGDGDFDLTVGNLGGIVRYYENTGSAGAAAFSQRTGAENPFAGVSVGAGSVPAIADLNNDGRPDLAVGGVNGTLAYLTNAAEAAALVNLVTAPGNAPSAGDLDGDGDLDLVVGRADGDLRYFKNTGTAAAPHMVEQTGAANPFNGINVGDFSAPRLVDLDHDGDLDAVVGERDGVINYFKNTGTAASPHFVEQTGSANPFNGIDTGAYSTPTFADIDGDGDQDMIVGTQSGSLITFTNTGSASAPSFARLTNPLNGIDVGDHAGPVAGDVDGDGDVDLVVVNWFTGEVHYLENTGSANSPVFVERTGTANPFSTVIDGSLAPELADLDHDGDLDLVLTDLHPTLNVVWNDFARVTINVTAQNDVPVAFDDAQTVTEDSAWPPPSRAPTPHGHRRLHPRQRPRQGLHRIEHGRGHGAPRRFLCLRPERQFDSLAPGESSRSASPTMPSVRTAAHRRSTPSPSRSRAPTTAVVSGLDASTTFAENTVDATPQIIDSNVTVTDAENDFTGGALTVSGLLAEDIVSIRDQGTGAGQIGFSGGDAPMAASSSAPRRAAMVQICVVTFNAAATSAAVGGLIDNLTYADTSDTPTASRDSRFRSATRVAFRCRSPSPRRTMPIRSTASSMKAGTGSPSSTSTMTATSTW